MAFNPNSNIGSKPFSSKCGNTQQTRDIVKELFGKQLEGIDIGVRKINFG